eukprot:4015399-Pyramimonas_sp.AAC.1
MELVHKSDAEQEEENMPLHWRVTTQTVRQLILLFETAYARSAVEVSVPGFDGRKRPIAYDIMSRMGGLPTILTLLRSPHVPWQR